MTSQRAPRGHHPPAAGTPDPMAAVEQLAADVFAEALLGRLVAGPELAEALRPIHDRLAAIERALGIVR